MCLKIKNFFFSFSHTEAEICQQDIFKTRRTNEKWDAKIVEAINVHFLVKRTRATLCLSVPGNTVEVLLWNHHLKENKLKRHVFLFKGFLLKTSWSVWQHIFICFLNNICSKKAWKDLCRQPCGEVSLSLVKSSLQNSLKIKINNFTFWLIIGCWTVCRWICFSSECLSLLQTDCVLCVWSYSDKRHSNTHSTVGVVTEALELWC